MRFSALVVPALVVIAVGSAMYHAIGAQRTATAGIHSADRISSFAQALVGRVGDAESAVRGYVLTGDTAFLAPYRSVEADARTAMFGLRAETRPDGWAASEVETLSRLSEMRLSHLRKVLRLSREESLGAARDEIASRVGLELMDSVRAAYSVISASAGVKARSEGVRAETRARLALLVLVGGLAVVIVLGISVSGVLLRAMRKEEANARHAAEQNERLMEHAEELEAQTEQLQDQALALQREADTRAAQSRALTTSEETLRTLIEGLDAGVIFFSENGEVNEYNASALRILRLESAEISARTLDCWDAIREDGSSYAAEELPVAITLATGKPQARVLMGIARPDGSRAWIAVSTRRVEYGPAKKWGVVASFADITERREAEIALDRQQEFLKALLENLSDAIVACDADGILTYFNSATQRIHGLPAEPLPPEEWADRYALYSADGKTPLSRDEIPLFRALNGEAVRNAEMVIAPTDRMPHRLLASGTAIHDVSGAKIGAVVVMRDVTDLTAAQKALEHSTGQLRQAQKMEAVGRLAGGVAHDFNNLLTAITSYAQFVLDDTAPDDPRRDDIGEIRAASDRAAALTRQLLAFSRRQVLRIQTMDPNASIVSVERLLSRIIGENVRITMRLDPAAWAIKCDPGQFEQVIFNLAINGRDAMPRGGPLTIETTNVEVGEAAASRQAGLVPGRYLELTVSDTGVGMDAETQSQIFEPFFTTKAVGKGTGLGLSTVYGIVTQCGGTVTVQSEPGVGTTFRILLPAANPDGVVAPTAERIAVQGRGTETVLLLEDDPTIRRVVERILKENGYTTIVAEDGVAALEIVRDRGKEIDMLITDMVMPGMSGREVVERIRSSNPEIRALIISGYSAEANGSHGAPPEVALLDKPFTAQQLTTRIREVLDKPIGGDA